MDLKESQLDLWVCRSSEMSQLEILFWGVYSIIEVKGMNKITSRENVEYRKEDLEPMFKESHSSFLCTVKLPVFKL